MTRDPRDIAHDALRHLREINTAARVLLGAIRVPPESRWPCFECGRPSPDAPLRTLSTTFAGGPPIVGTGPMLHGCWTCNTHDKIETLNDACRNALAYGAEASAELAALAPVEPWPFAEPAPGLEDAVRDAAETPPLVRALRSVARRHGEDPRGPIDVCIAQAFDMLADQLDTEPEETNG